MLISMWFSALEQAVQGWKLVDLIGPKLVNLGLNCVIAEGAQIDQLVADLCLIMINFTMPCRVFVRPNDAVCD